MIVSSSHPNISAPRAAVVTNPGYSDGSGRVSFCLCNDNGENEPFLDAVFSRPKSARLADQLLLNATWQERPGGPCGRSMILVLKAIAPEAIMRLAQVS